MLHFYHTARSLGDGEGTKEDISQQFYDMNHNDYFDECFQIRSITCRSHSFKEVSGAARILTDRGGLEKDMMKQ